MKPELFHSEEKTNLFGVEYKLCQSCCIRIDFIKDRGGLTDSKRLFFIIILIMYFFEANRLLGLIRFVTLSFSALDRLLMLM